MAKGKIPHSSTGYYIVDENPEWRKRPKESNKHIINLVTPVALTLEQAKADLKKENEKKAEEANVAQRLKKRQYASIG